jgi:hypothetical protein
MTKFKFHFIISFVLITLLGITSCANESYTPTPRGGNDNTFVSDTFFINNSYPPFPEGFENVIEQLGFCSDSDSSKPNCSHHLFRVFALGPEIPLQEGFMLEARAGVLSDGVTKALAVMLFDGETYQMQNFLKGKLLETRTTKEGHFDILMKYRAEGINTISVKHQWDDRSGAFLPQEVEELNEHFVKEEYKDSLKHRYLSEFAWGN